MEEAGHEPKRNSRQGIKCQTEGNGMFKNRREFLAVLIGSGAPAVFFVERLTAQNHPPPQSSPPPGPPGASQQRDANPPDPDLAKSASKAILEANEKDIKKNVEKLYTLASELKAEVDKTDSSQVLNLGMIKKTEEIEKLAKEIRARAKG